MRINLECLFAVLFLSFTQLKAQEATVFKNVNVVPIHTKTVLMNRDVLVKNGIVESIEKTSNRKYAGANIINATGQYLMPGLADMHVHIPRQQKYGYGQDQFLMLQLASGVTTVRSMRGADVDLMIQKEAAAGKIISPDVYTSAPPFYASRVWIRSDSLGRLLKSYKNKGYQSLKVLSVPSVAWFDTLAQMAQLEGFRLSGHVPNGVSIDHAIGKNLNSIEHLGGYENLKVGSAELENALAMTVSKGVYNCPTLNWYFVNYTQTPYEDLKKQTGLDRIPPAMVRDWTKTFDDYFAQQAKKQPDSLLKEQQAEKEYVNKKLAVLKQLHQKGAKLLISPDVSTVFQVPGLAMIEEMKIYKKAGIAEYDILKAATLNAAEYMGEGNEWGSVQKGMRANLLLLEANPLEDLENIKKVKGVMKRGQWFSASKIEELLQTCKQNYRE